MADTLLKIKWLFTVFFLSAFHDWMDNLWCKDLDSHYCCDGFMCGCGGVTHREIYNGKKRKANND